MVLLINKQEQIRKKDTGYTVLIKYIITSVCRAHIHIPFLVNVYFYFFLSIYFLD